MIKNNKSLTYWTLFGLAGSILAVLIVVSGIMLIGVERIQTLDENVQSLLFPSLDGWYYSLLPFFKGITEFGSFNFSLIVALTFVCYYGLFRRLFVEVYLVAISFIGMWVINYCLKMLLRRERPELEQLMAAHGYSFPSGHSMIAAGFYGVILVLNIRALKDRGWSGSTPAVLGILFILLLGYSRIYLGVHYPSDVVTGLLAGGIWAYSMYRLLQASYH